MVVLIVDVFIAIPFNLITALSIILITFKTISSSISGDGGGVDAAAAAAVMTGTTVYIKKMLKLHDTV